MRRLTLVATLAAGAVYGQAPSNPEIYLLPLTVSGTRIAVGAPTNITNRAGYDNQPSFTPDGRAILYTSVREDAQADIYRYDIASKKTTRLTRTDPESEYSAATMPKSSRFSVIRVERDSAQRLWSFAADGSSPGIVLEDIKPVGYHTWINENLLGLFVLGNPNALVLADRRSPRRDTLARDIGRSLVAFPHGGGFSFFSRHGQDWVLTAVRLTAAGKVVYIEPLTTLPRGMDYVTWIGGTALGGTGSKLMSWTPGAPWTELADLSAQGVSRISRIALSPDHRRLAIVAEPGR
jgi:hypothetical protein